MNSWDTRRRDWFVAVTILVAAAAVSLLTGDVGWILVMVAAYIAVIVYYAIQCAWRRMR